jgi:hypothetical protein
MSLASLYGKWGAVFANAEKRAKRAPRGGKNQAERIMALQSALSLCANGHTGWPGQHTSTGQIRNPKHEIRNNLEEQELNPKITIRAF